MEGDGDASQPGSGSAGPAAGARISLHNFRGRLAEQVVHFHAMGLQDSLFLWVGEEPPQLSNLAVAMCTPRGENGSLGRIPLCIFITSCNQDSIPVSTSLLGDASDSTSNSLAQRLASKTKKQIFVSYNIKNTDSSFTLLVENRIKEEMTAFPEKFSLEPL